MVGDSLHHDILVHDPAHCPLHPRHICQRRARHRSVDCARLVGRPRHGPDHVTGHDRLHGRANLSANHWRWHHVGRALAVDLRLLKRCGYGQSHLDKSTFAGNTDGSETPAYEVNVTAVGRSVEDTQLSRTIGPLIQTGPVKINVFTGAVEIGTYKTTTITETWTSDRKSRSISTLVTGLDFDIDRNYTLAPRSNTVIAETYSQAIDGKLLTRTTTVSRDRRFIDARLTNSTITYNGSTLSSTDLVQDSQTVETWTYDDELPIVYVKEIYSIALKLDGAARRLELYLKERLTETYTDLGGGEWLKVVEDEERIFLDSVTLYPRGESGTFQGPDYAPREPSRHAPIAKTEPQNYTGSSTYDVAGSTEEPAEYEINYGVSDAQALELAEWWGALLVGRDQAWTASHELTRAWVEGWSPSAKVKLTLPDGDIIAALVDGVNISINQAAAFVSYGATELGVIGSSGNNIIPPYTQRVNGQVSVVQMRGVSNPLAGVPTEGNVSGRVSVVQVSGISGDYSEGVNNRASVVQVAGIRTGNAGTVEQLATLSVSRGGTGGGTAAQARANLGIDLAGGDLTGSYPTPALAAQYKPLVAKGDLYGHDGLTPIRIPVGSTGQTVYADPAEPSGIRWGAASGGVVSAKGDLFTHNDTDSARLPVGTDGQMLYASPAAPTGLAWGAAPAGGGGGGGSLVLNAFRVTQITQSAIGAFPFDDEGTGTTDWASNVWTAPQDYSALLVLAQLRVTNQNRVVFAIRLNKASVVGEVWEDVVTCDRPQGLGGTAGTGGGFKDLSVLTGDQLRMTTFTTETYRGDVNGSQSYFQLYAL